MSFHSAGKKQQAILEKVQEHQSRVPEMPIPQNPTSQLRNFNETFNILTGMENPR